jgi:PST family polysaccharide transporter
MVSPPNPGLSAASRAWRTAAAMPMLRKVASNTWWLFADRVLRMLFGLTIGIWVARYLGPQQFGLLNYVIAVVALFASVVPLGLDTIVVRELVHTPEQSGSILGTTFVLRVLAGLLMSVAALLFASLSPGTNHQIILLTAIIALTVVPRAADVFDLCFQSRMQSKLTVAAKNAGTLIGNAGRILLIIFSASLTAFCWITSIEAIIGALGLAVTYVISGNNFRHWSFNGALARRLLRESWPMILSGMFILLYMRIDVVMLKTMAGDATTGVYSAAYRVSEICYIIPTALTTSVSPIILALRKSDQALYLRRIRQLFSILIALSLCLSVFTTLTAHWIVNILYSTRFAQAAPILAVHIWASVFVFLGVAQGTWDVAENALPYTLYRTIIGAAANIAINLLLIPRFGGMGAAIATLISYAISGTFANLLFSKTRPAFWLQVQSLGMKDLTRTVFT